MTTINRLTQLTSVGDDDLFPVWDYTNGRTRSVSGKTFKEYAAADEIVNAKIVNDHLILITKQGEEIDAGKLPTSDGIDIQNDGNDIGEFSTINFNEGLIAKPSDTFGVVSEIDIDKDKVYTKDQSLPIKIDDLDDITRITTGSGLYSLKKDNDAELVNRAPFARALRFDQSLTLNEPYDGLTAIYATFNTAVDDVFHLDIDPDDPRLNKDWVFTIAIDSDITKSTLECKIGKTNPISFNLATGFAVLEVDSQKGEFVVHNQSSTVTGDLPSTFCDLSNAEWKNIPSKEWIVREGTLSGFGSGVDGKTAKIRCQVSNSSIDTTEIALRAIDHVYTIISDDATINGRVFVRTAKSKSTFDAAVLREETNNTGSGEITVDGNAADKIVSGDGIKTSFDAASKTATIIAEDFDQPDVAGFGTVSELPRHLIKSQLDVENLTYTYDDDKFNARFANGEPGPAFKITAQKLGHSKWEFGFTYNDRLTQYQTVMARMLIQFIPDESTGKFEDLIKKVDFRCEKAIAGVFKHEHKGQDLLELWCIAATNEFPNRFFLEIDLSANEDKYVFHTREPQFTEYLFPWNDINKPPQFVQLEEGMNNQGKMGSGSNIDSGSVTQGKVYVENFSPSNGGPEGLEGDSAKGYVIKHFGFNDQDTASVIWFYNFAGDIYVKMNKNQGDKGRWYKVTGSRFANTRSLKLEATGQEYLSIDRESPVLTTDEQTDNLELIKIISPESDDALPKVKRVFIGDLASGFSVCPDGTAEDTEILQASSGTYSLETMVFAADASVNDPVYVSNEGKLTLDESKYVVGWVIENGVIIDVDLYNATVEAANTCVEKYSKAQLSGLEVAYLGQFGEGRIYPPISLEQVVGSANTLLKHTSAFQLESYDRNSGDKVADILSADKDGFNMLVKPMFNGENLSLAKDVPVIPDNGYIENYSQAELESMQVSYQGKYGDERAFYPVRIYQDVNGWSQLEFTGNMQFKTKNKDTGVVGDKVFEVQLSSSVFHKKVEMKEPLNITKNTGTVLTINDEAVKFWSSGAIELPSYTAFKDKELITKEYAQQLIDESSGSDYHGEGLGVPEGEFFTTGTMNQSQPVALYYNALNDGSSRGNIELNNDDGYNEFQVIISGGIKATRDWRVGTGTPGRFSDKTIRIGETWLCRVFVDWNASSNTNFFWQRLDDGTSGYVLENDLNFAIEENNDEIITPNRGEQFQLIDSSKTASYGNANKQVSYFAPNVGTQSEILLSKLDYGKVFAIHEEINTTKLIMFIHESLVAEIYNRDITGVNELTMLFTGNSRGRLGKANQTAAAQFSINWNGELIPAADDPNALNPEHWVAPDDSVTETWSNSVKSVCYSNGVLANRGSAMLKRGDVIYSKPESVTHDDSELLETPRNLSNALGDSGETATITYNNDSEFFVMPIIAGGGTFNVMKLFQLFMGRKSQYVEEWGSLKFDQSSDCIGTILKIAYDAAIAEEEKEEQTQNDELMEGIASGFIYAKSVSVG